MLHLSIVLKRICNPSLIAIGVCVILLETDVCFAGRF